MSQPSKVDPPQPSYLKIEEDLLKLGVMDLVEIETKT